MARARRAPWCGKPCRRKVLSENMQDHRPLRRTLGPCANKMGIKNMTKTKTQDGASFEKDLERLEEIVAGLEEGGLPLEESLKQFEEGVALVRQCEKTLKAAERKIDMLVRGEGGEMETVPFDESGEDAAGETETPNPSPAPTTAPRKRQAPGTTQAPEETPVEDGGDLLF